MSQYRLNRAWVGADLVHGSASGMARVMDSYLANFCFLEQRLPQSVVTIGFKALASGSGEDPVAVVPCLCCYSDLALLVAPFPERFDCRFIEP